MVTKKFRLCFRLKKMHVLDIFMDSRTKASTARSCVCVKQYFPLSFLLSTFCRENVFGPECKYRIPFAPYFLENFKTFFSPITASETRVMFCLTQDAMLFAPGYNRCYIPRISPFNLSRRFFSPTLRILRETAK